MPANVSLLLNVLLLLGVIAAIVRLIRSRKKQVDFSTVSSSPTIGAPEIPFDDIIAVRRVCSDESPPEPDFIEENSQTVAPNQEKAQKSSKSILILLMAKGQHQLAGYSLLQTLLAAGLRFGNGQMFHRHQSPNGQGPVLCSLAAASPTGIFDLQNIGAFTTRGLCLFMQASENPTIDAERFSIMLEIAETLRDDLDVQLLDDQQNPLTEQRLVRYCNLLNIPAVSFA